jgi:hypothetical protein
MILFQIHSKRVTLLELKGDAPWTIHMDRVPRWPMTPQPVEIETREVEVGWHGRRVQCIEHQQGS